MELSAKERLVLLAILPAEGNFATLKIVRQLREDLSFDEAEHERLQLVRDGTNLRWNAEADTPKPFEFGNKAMVIIVEALEDLNKEKKLRDEHLSLCEKFLGDTGAA